MALHTSILPRMASWYRPGIYQMVVLAVGTLIGIVYYWNLRLAKASSPIPALPTDYHGISIVAQLDSIVMLYGQISSRLLIRSDTKKELDTEFMSFIDKLRELHTKHATSEGHPNEKPVACPEVYGGALSDYPDYLHNWKRTNCNYSQPLSRLLTVGLVYLGERNERRYENFHKAIENLLMKYSGIHVLIATDQSGLSALSTKHKSVHVRIYKKPWNRLTIWNNLISLTNTPFFLVARSFQGLGIYSDLTRAVDILNQYARVHVISFGNLNEQRLWRGDCFQLGLNSYKLKISDGYRRSFNECKVCDYVQGPFIAKTTTLQGTPFVANLETEEIGMLHFFLMLHRQGNFVLNCPECMMLMSGSYDILPTNNKPWLPFIQKWQLNRVQLPSGDILSFTCKESFMKCKLGYYTNSGLTIPICCVQAMSKMTKDFFDFCNKYGMHCEIDTGSVLSAVKLGGPMPWDLDIDAGFHKDNLTVFQKHIPELKEKGYIIEGDDKGHSFVIRFLSKELRGVTADIYTYTPHISVGNMHSGTFLPTQIMYDNYLVNVPYNPGLFVRNRYGVEVYRHSPSWSSFKRTSSYANYTGGQLVPCSTPGHHACMDTANSDGNLDFGWP